MQNCPSFLKIINFHKQNIISDFFHHHYHRIAPWCGHCKKLAPTLDKMATYISGKFAIGKIDCTIHTSLCKDSKFNVKGYPTLKIYKDGNFFDYSGKRDADSMIGFMEKMSLPSVTLVHSTEEFTGKALDVGDENVAFLAYDPKAKEGQQQQQQHSKKAAETAVPPSSDITPVEKFIASTNFLQIYGQISRILQSSTSFALLHPSKFEEVSKLFENKNDPGLKLLKKNQPWILRYEKGTRPMIYIKENGGGSDTAATSEEVMKWVKANNLPLVSKLEGHNFRTVSNLGKPLVIGITNNDDDKKHKATEEAFLQELLDLAQDGPAELIQKYKFAQMNGKKFHSFLSQFNITSTSRIPQAVVVNVKERTYYQNETYIKVIDLLQGIEKGEIEERKQDDGNGKGFVDKVQYWFVSNMPMSAVVFVLVLIILFLIVAVACLDDDNVDSTEELVRKMQLQQRLVGTHQEGKVKRKTMKED